MLQEPAGHESWVHNIRDWWGAVLLVGGLVFGGIVQRLTGFFPTRRELNEFGTRTGTLEKLTMGNQDKLAEHERRLDRHEGEIDDLREHGSEPSRRLSKDMTEIRVMLAEMRGDLKHLLQRQREG